MTAPTATAANLAEFIGRSQLAVIRMGLRGAEAPAFVEILDRVSGIVENMAKTYEQDGANDPIVALHYFKGGADWFITEKDAGYNGDATQAQAFGVADLYHDGGELGYISIAELIAHGVELDLHFEPRPLSAVRAARR